MEYSYSKERRLFGRQCFYIDRHQVLADIPSNPLKVKHFISKNPANHSTQLTKQMALSEVLTENASYRNRGINHMEGGWPKDVNYLDEEQTTRQRKKLERDDQWYAQMPGIAKIMLHGINQNNAVRIYEKYFQEMRSVQPHIKSTARMTQCYRDPLISERRTANHISFSPDGGLYMAVAYVNMDEIESVDKDEPSYVWEVANPQNPIVKLSADASCTKLEYNNKESRVIIGGLTNGKVCVWDTRLGGRPQLSTKKEFTHAEKVTSLLWTHSKSNTEFYSGSADGQIYWWDSRYLDQSSIDSLLCDPLKTDDQDPLRSYACSALEYEFTIPTKYMIGTEEGYIFFGNRKGRTPTEKISSKVHVSKGPIYSLERNPGFTKNILVLSDYSIEVWAEDCKENHINWSVNHKNQLQCGTWNRQRSSLLFAGLLNGTCEIWDLILDQLNPIISIKVSDSGINHIRSHENGLWAACADSNGDVNMLELSANLSSNTKNERTLLGALFDRETGREKIMEGKLREIRLKYKQTEDELTEGPKSPTSKSPEHNVANIPNEFEEIRYEQCQRRARALRQNRP